MANLDLFTFMEQPVLICCSDGRIIVGILKGFDANANLVLANCHERVFSKDDPVQAIQLGSFVLRGDSVAFIGEIDASRDSEIDYGSLRATPLNAFVQ